MVVAYHDTTQVGILLAIDTAGIIVAYIADILQALSRCAWTSTPPVSPACNIITPPEDRSNSYLSEDRTSVVYEADRIRPASDVRFSLLA